MYRYHSPLYSRAAAAMGVSEAFSSKIICERYIHALSIHAHIRVYTRAWKMHGSVVFITARNALSTEYHFRGTSHHCNEPRFMLKCTRALTRATRTTAPPLTSPRTLPTYLLTYFTGGKSISLSRNLGVDVPLIFRADHRGKRARAAGQFSAGGRVRLEEDDLKHVRRAGIGRHERVEARSEVKARGRRGRQ